MSAAPSFRFDLPALVELLLHKQPDPFVLQIGAMDGIQFDPLHPILRNGGWRGLLVEPLPDLFEMLRANYKDCPGLGFANVAVTEQSGTQSMYRVDPHAIAAGRTPQWAIGISSFFKDRNSLGGVRTSAEDFACVKPFVTQEQVQCITLAKLIRSHAIERIDLLQIDTEGYDFRILQQLDFTRFRPAVIHLEHYLLPADERQACFSLLLGHNYVVGCTHKDVLATTLLNN